MLGLLVMLCVWNVCSGKPTLEEWLNDGFMDGDNKAPEKRFEMNGKREEIKRRCTSCDCCPTSRCYGDVCMTG